MEQPSSTLSSVMDSHNDSLFLNFDLQNSFINFIGLIRVNRPCDSLFSVDGDL